MKKLTNTIYLACIIFACCVLAVAQSQKDDAGKKGGSAPEVSSKYNKSKDLTTVRLKPFKITTIGQEKQIGNNIPLHQMDLEISYSYSGQKITKPVEDVNLRFHAVAGNYVFLKGQQVIAVLDKEVQGQDRAISLGTTDYKSVAPKFNSVYEEFLSLNIPPDALVKMAKAETVEIYVGPVGYRLSTELHNAIRALASQLSGNAS